MGISDIIASFIDEALRDEGTAELQRSELASRFNCVPSQINYVISTRFSPERGYIVESRRGGGGYIRIRRVQMDPKQLLMHTVNAVGDAIDQRSAAAFITNLLNAGAIEEQTARMMAAATSESALRPAQPMIRDVIRASLFKQMLLHTIY